MPVPTARAEQVLVEAEWCGICGAVSGEYRDGLMNIPLQEHSLHQHLQPGDSRGRLGRVRGMLDAAALARDTESGKCVLEEVSS